MITIMMVFIIFPASGVLTSLLNTLQSFFREYLGRQLEKEQGEKGSQFPIKAR
jgi:hypothetical protein